MDRNGKKPKATQNQAPHPERSDTKVHSGGEIVSSDAEQRAAAEHAKSDARQAQVDKKKKGPQHL